MLGRAPPLPLVVVINTSIHFGHRSTTREVSVEAALAPLLYAVHTHAQRSLAPGGIPALTSVTGSCITICLGALTRRFQGREGGRDHGLYHRRLVSEAGVARPPSPSSYSVLLRL